MDWIKNETGIDKPTGNAVIRTCRDTYYFATYTDWNGQWSAGDFNDHDLTIADGDVTHFCEISVPEEL
jgi:hypothetical protein